MEHLNFVAAPADDIAFAHQLIDLRLFGNVPAEPRGLLIEGAIESKVLGVDVNRGAGCVMDAAQADDVINVSMRDDNGRDFEAMVLDDLEDPLRFIARIDDDGFVSYGIADDVAIALQHADGKNFVNEFLQFAHGRSL